MARGVNQARLLVILILAIALTTAAGSTASQAACSIPGPTALTPDGAQTTTQPTFTWQSTLGPNYYRLRISGPQGTVFEQYIKASETDPDADGLSSYTVPQWLPNGSYTWRVNSYCQGLTGWSRTLAFTVNDPTGDGFNYSFRDSMGGWSQVAGNWSQVDDQSSAHLYSYLTCEGPFNTAASIAYTNQAYDDFVFKVKMARWVSGGGQPNNAGLANIIFFRGDGVANGSDFQAWQNGYHFAWTLDGNTCFGKRVNGAWEFLKFWTLDAPLAYPPAQAGRWQTVVVYAKGDQILITMNGHTMIYVQDSDLPSGFVGVGFYRGVEAEGLSIERAELKTDDSHFPAWTGLTADLPAGVVVRPGAGNGRVDRSGAEPRGGWNPFQFVGNDD